MLRRGQTTTFPERLDITERAAAGQSNSEIAAALGCSVWTVRKWRSLRQHQGRTGLSSQMGRPPTGPLSTLPTGMREAIVQMRRTHPGWGPTTLLAELRVDPRWSDQPLPSRSRIAARLRAERLTRRYEKHCELPIPVIQPEGAPHDEWELDAQGSMHVAGVGKVSLITVIDVVSRRHRSRAIPAWIRPIPRWKPINSCCDEPSSAWACPGASPSITARSFTTTPRRRRFRPACICGCWLMAHRHLLHAASVVPPTTPKLSAPIKP